VVMRGSHTMRRLPFAWGFHLPSLLTSASQRAADRAECATDALGERADNADDSDNNQPQHDGILNSGRAVFTDQES
jgi:hypothetical protein